MPLVYVPKYMRDIDYKLLKIVDLLGGRSEINFKLMDKLNLSPKKLENVVLSLSKENLLTLIFEGDAIIEIVLTPKAQVFLAEHILGVNKL